MKVTEWSFDPNTTLIYGYCDQDDVEPIVINQTDIGKIQDAIQERHEYLMEHDEDYAKRVTEQAIRFATQAIGSYWRR